MNIFLKIGKKIEKENKEADKCKKKYLSLNPIDRIDYNLEFERIKKANSWSPIELSWFFSKFVLVAGVFLTLFGFYKHDFLRVTIALHSLLNFYFSSILVFLSIDLILFIFYKRTESTKIKKLKKRFKLC